MGERAMVAWVGEANVKRFTSFVWFRCPGGAFEMHINHDDQEDYLRQYDEIIRKIDAGELPNESTGMLAGDRGHALIPFFDEVCAETGGRPNGNR